MKENSVFALGVILGILLGGNCGETPSMKVQMDSPIVLREASQPQQESRVRLSDLSIDLSTTQKDLLPQVRHELRLVWSNVSSVSTDPVSGQSLGEDPSRLWFVGDADAPKGVESIPVTVACTKWVCEASLPSGRRAVQPVDEQGLSRDPIVRAAALAVLRCVSPPHAMKYAIINLNGDARHTTLVEIWRAEAFSDSAFLRPDGSVDWRVYELVKDLRNDN